ncbi:MAG: VWA domain-containing protein, partial [Lachnospiraceae bacterium]|nr:VWA domain-containing protein [Lachnospiraceae bacterium]
QCLTNFEYTNEVAKEMSQAEAAVFMKFANTLEDPAIEYFAPNIFGGRLLEALRFSIKHIYQKSTKIDDSSSPFNQLINALIHFGDMGMVKGSFTFPEAKEYFEKIAPLYNKGITCPDSRERINIAKECMEQTRPLWEEMVKNQDEFQKLLDELMKALQSFGPHLMGDKEKSMKPTGAPNKAQERRERIAKRLKDSANTEDAADDASNSDESSDSSDNKSADSSEANSSPDSAEDKPNSKASADGGGSIPDESLECNADDYTATSEDANKLAEDEYVLDDGMLDEIEKSLKNEEARVEREHETESKTDELPDFSISSSAFRSARCLNRRIDCKSSGIISLYNAEVAKYNREIKTLKKALDQIFKSDMEENNRATSGSYNIMRGSIGTTARIFDKRRDPANLKDAAVVLAVDLSGSMSGAKEAQARKTCIILAEALSELKIPYYIMGFKADTESVDALHEHYVDWNGKKKDRASLINMRAGGNNFDGYSIRYAAELLKNKNASNKILFVISDGQPACHKYYGYNSGVADTINAIKDARKCCTTFGIALGRGCGPTILQKMYGKDFIYCEDEKLLANTLGKKLGKLLKTGAR